MLKSAYAIATAALLTACSTVSQNIAMAPDSEEALVLVAGAGLGGNRTGAVFRAFDPVEADFYSDTFRIADDGFLSDEVKVKDEAGKSALSQKYFLRKTKPGVYVLTTDVRSTTTFIEGRAVNASALLCRRSGVAFEVLAGRINVINPARPDADDATLAAYSADVEKIRAQFPNLTADLIVAAPLGVVDFYGDDTQSLAAFDLNACPRGVSNYAPGATASATDDRAGDIIVIEE